MLNQLTSGNDDPKVTVFVDPHAVCAVHANADAGCVRAGTDDEVVLQEVAGAVEDGIDAVVNIPVRDAFPRSGVATRPSTGEIADAGATCRPV